MELTFSKEELAKASRQTVRAMLEELDKESQVSVRIDSDLRNALEVQTQAWKYKNISQTVRTILSFYFLPAVYKLEWKGKDFTKLMQGKEKYSSDRIRANYFLKSLVEYMALLEQTKQASREVLSFAEGTEKQLNAIIEEMAGKMQKAIQEVESKQGAE